MLGIPKAWIWTVIVAATVPYSLASPSHLDLGSGFDLTVNQTTNHLAVSHGKRIIWETIAHQPFLSASAGSDQVIGSNGNFKIKEIDRSKCTGQHISRVNQKTWPSSANKQAAVIQGFLTGCGNSSAAFSLALWVPAELPDRIAFNVNVNPGNSSNDPATKLFLTYRSSSSEDFYGLGGQASFASLKNQSVPIFSREQGVGRGDQPTTDLESEDSFFAGGDQFTTYTAVPQYISSHSRVFHLSEESTAYTTFDFRDLNAVTVRYASLEVDGYFMQAKDMLHGITMLTEYTGRMPDLPTWVDSGAVLGIQGGQKKVNRIVDQGLREDCPIAAVWLQDWSGTHTQSVSYMTLNISRLWWNWEYDSELYPTWPNFVQNLRNQHNVRTLSYINPFLANVSTKPDGFRRDLFSEATKGGYMIQNSTTNKTSIVSSGPGIEAGILDLTNPATRTWFRDVLIDQVWNANISGYMGDFGEYTPVLSDTRFANRSINPLFYHNQYPRDWAKLHHSLAKNVSSFSDAIIFHRSASMAANRYMNVYWAGDQNTNWGVNDGIKSSVTVMGHMGLSGYAHGHTEVGGYTTTWDSHGTVNRSAELLGRWGELSAVSSAVFRSHEGNVPQVNAQFYTNSSTYSYHAYNARLFASLATYRRHILDTESKLLGWPLLRMPVIYHPNDVNVKAISYESFFLGSDLYIAPVLDPGRKSVDVYLPGKDEMYTHVWTGRKYRGGQKIQVPAPYGKPAVFVVGRPKHDYLKSFFEFVQKENGTVIHV
ncbi:Sulfoquinovosidase [Penicillium rolfsii]|nr:Sulfoquinovosidase [Penicillium rolfsii]